MGPPSCPHDWYPAGGNRERCDLCGAVRRVEGARLPCPRGCGRSFVRKDGLLTHMASICAPTGVDAMSDPWWRPIADAIAKKAAQLILAEPDASGKEDVILDAKFEEVPAKAPPKRRKALPPRPDPPSEEGPSPDEK